MFIDRGLDYESLFVLLFVIAAVLLLANAPLIIKRFFPKLTNSTVAKKLAPVWQFVSSKKLLLINLILIGIIVGVTAYVFSLQSENANRSKALIICGIFIVLMALANLAAWILKRNKKLKLKLYALLAFDLALVALTVAIVIDMGAMPHVKMQYPTDNMPLSDFTRPIEVVFDRPVNLTTLKPYIFPELKGSWKVEPANQNFPYIKRVLRFYAEETAFPEQKLFLYYAGITNTLGNLEPWEYSVNAYTTQLPKPLDSAPPSGSVDVPVTEEFQIVFDGELNSSYEWQIGLEPAAEISISTDNNQIKVKPVSSLKHNTDYIIRVAGIPIRFTLPGLEVVERGEPIELGTFNFKTVTEPLLEKIEPGNGALVHEPIKVVFDQPMDRDSVQSAFTITPAVNGSFKWEDRSLIFEHDPLGKDTEYQVKLPAGLKSIKGGLTQQEITHVFRTIGPVAVSWFNPANGSGRVAIGSNVSVGFNQPVDHASAQSKFSISPAVDGSFGWDGNSMIFNPHNNFNYQTGYTARVAAGVKTINGLDSRTEASASFTTQSEEFMLNVPVYYQKLRFSCNLEAARMALAYRGVSKSIDTLHSQIAKDSTPYDEVNNIFGNPYSGYTGDIYGKTKGYGVYWGPLSSLIGRYRSNSIKTGWNLESLLNEVKAGNPVIIWAHNGYSYAGNAYYWKTPDGQTIRAVTGMHSYVVVGYKGPTNNPSHVIVNDSNRGRWTISKDYFMGLWSYFNNTGIVVY